VAGDEDPAVRLQHVATRLLRLARAPEKAGGLTSAQYAAMAVLHAQPGISVVELARIEHVAHPTMSRMVAALVKAGLVARTADDADKRIQSLHLTDAGRSAYLSAAERRVALFRFALARLSPAATAELLALADEFAALADAKQQRP
jgi:MarR family transcriptional regulator, temperature-dependent positive regulator of motility